MKRKTFDWRAEATFATWKPMNFAYRTEPGGIDYLGDPSPEHTDAYFDAEIAKRRPSADGLKVGDKARVNELPVGTIFTLVDDRPDGFLITKKDTCKTAKSNIEQNLAVDACPWECTIVALPVVEVGDLVEALKSAVPTYAKYSEFNGKQSRVFKIESFIDGPLVQTDLCGHGGFGLWPLKDVRIIEKGSIK